MKKKLIVLISAIAVISVIMLQLLVNASKLPFNNLYERGFEGYTSDEDQVLSSEHYSSKPISVSEGDVLYFGPCVTTQYFQLVGFSGDKAVTGKIRGKELTLVESFENGMVIYSYTVGAGIDNVVFSNDSSVEPVYVVSKTPFTNLSFRAYWTAKGTDVTPYVGQSSYYEVNAGDKLYFGAITEESALGSKLFNNLGEEIGTISASDLTVVENFGGDFSIYCYTTPETEDIAYVFVNYDANYSDYYKCVVVKSDQAPDEEQIVQDFIESFGVPQPDSATVSKLSGKSALFVGDSITYGSRDLANIYKYGGWAGRIGYYCGMDVLNNGVSGACITTSRLASNGEGHYIYNNLDKAKSKSFDYVIMHGLFNDASDKVAVGTPQGAASFNPDNANVAQFAGALENLFYTAKKLYPNAKYGYIVNFHTERIVDQEPYVDAAIDICEDWGIPYLDLYHMEDFSVEFDDGLHPTSSGYDSIYTIVADWMATLD